MSACILLQSHEILNDFFAVDRFIQKQKNAAGKEMEKKADINLVDLAGRSVVFALFSLQCCSSCFDSCFTLFIFRHTSSWIHQKLTDNTTYAKMVLLHNGGSCNAFTIKRSITLLCTVQCAFLNRAHNRMVLFFNSCFY
jgi:hypothetical protein